MRSRAQRKAGRLLILAAMTIAGCAMQPPIPRKPLRRLIVLEVQPAVGDRALHRVMDASKDVTPETLATDRQHINEAVTRGLSENLRCGEPVPVVADSDYSQAGVMGRPLDPATLSMLQQAHPGDAYLRLRVTDYGETPRRWQGAYVTFEVVTTLGIAGALYAHRVTRAVAGAYLLEESIEEFSEGYAGSWALNRLSRPVRIEMDLLDGQTGQLLGSETHVGLAPWSWQHVWHMDAATRDQLLSISTHKALQSLSPLCELPSGQ